MQEAEQHAEAEVVLVAQLLLVLTVVEHDAAQCVRRLHLCNSTTGELLVSLWAAKIKTFESIVDLTEVM